MQRALTELAGHAIDAADDRIGTVRWPVVDTGNWLTGRKVLAGMHAVVACLVTAGLSAVPHPAAAAEAIQTFGPGKVSCQPLTGTQLDCLLTASRVTDERNVATFGVDQLPAEDLVLFRKWCLTGSNGCSVTLTGRRESAQSTRLAAVTSVHWTRAGAPENEEVARTADRTPAFEPKGAAAPR